MVDHITFLGAGSMATACAVVLAEHAGQEVTLWSRDAATATKIDQDRENRRLLQGVKLSESIAVTADRQKAVDHADVLVVAIPTQYLREALQPFREFISDETPVVSVVKGLENESMMRPTQIVQDVLGTRKVLSLGGPSHAEEIARRMPASVVIAGDDLRLARKVQALFATDRFRVYTNVDLIGTELGGAVKNVIAIAAGLCDGLGFGDNAKSALLTRGSVEMARFGEAFGAQQRTFAGLAGMGDLMTTCFSQHSRNRGLGERLGRGETLDEIRSKMVHVAEGVNTTKSVYQYATENEIEMPIVREVFAVLFEGKSPQEATDALMKRPPTVE